MFKMIDGALRVIKKILPLSLILLLVSSGLPLDILMRKIADYFATPVAQASHGPRVRTVEFFAGQDAGSGINDNVGAQNNFPVQTVQLAESGADVIDAYIEVSLQFGSATVLTSTEGLLFFDACTPTPCTPSPLSFMDTASFGTNSGESQTAQLRANVAPEAALAAYTGGGSQFSFQVGYCIDGASGTDAGTCNGTVAANIQGANAKLVITYTYDHTSPTQTNTVIYPLDSGTDIGSRTAAQVSCTVDSNCPTFSYTTTIPEIGTQLSQFFYLQTSINAVTTTDWQTISDIGGNPGGANTSAVFFEEILTDNGGWVNALLSGVAGYANNTAQSLEMSTNATNAYVMGGENYVTYTYADTAPTKTKTVVYPVGEVQTVGSLTESALVGSTVYFPESGVNVERAWFRIHTSAGGQTAASTLNIRHQVGANPASGQRGYAFASDTQGVSDDGYFNYIIPASEYTELEGATGSSGRAVQMRAQWSGTARGAVSAELVITYTYTSDVNGYIVSQHLFAGQQTSAAATTFSTSAGAINPSIPEPSTDVTIRGASLRLTSVGQAVSAPVANEGIGINFSTSPSACSSSNSSTAVTDNERTRLTLWRFFTNITSNDATTYTACYSSAEVAIHGGILTVTYQYTIPNTVTVALDPSFTQPANVTQGQNNVVMGVFTFITSASAATVNAITISETNASFTANGNLTGVQLYWQQEATCTFAGSVAIGAPVNFTSETAVLSGLGLGVNTAQICVFVEMDIGANAGAGQSIEIAISASGDVGVTGGAVVGSFPLNVPGATNIRADQGTVMSTPVDFDWVAGQTGWGSVIWAGTETGGDIKIQVYRKNVADCDTLLLNTELSGNEAGFDINTINLSSLADTAVVYNRLCLKATLTAVSASPILDDWRVTWQAAGGSGLQQSGYRFFANLDSANVGVALKPQNTAHTLGLDGDPFRLRMLIHSSALLGLSGQNFKLRYVGKGTGTCAAPTAGTPATYTDVTNTTLIAFKDNAGTANNIALIDNAGELTHAADAINPQTYHDVDTSLTPFTNSQSAIAAGADGKWDFSLFDSSAPSAKTYCFKIVKNDGTDLDGGYTVYPEIISAAVYPATGTYTSNDINITPLRAWNVLEWDWTLSPASPVCTVPSPCNLRIQIRTAGAQAGLGVASWLGPDGTGATYYQGATGINRVRAPITHNNQPWLNYRVTFDGDGAHTPVLNRVKLNYQ